MDSFLREFIMILGSYLGVVVLIFAGLNFFSSGFLFTWLKVKMSRGSKILLTIRTVVGDYYSTGIIDKGFLIFIDKKKEERRINLHDEDANADNNAFVFKSIGVNNIVVDDEKNSVFSRNLNGVSGFDAVKYNDLYIRALYKPAIFDGKEKLLLALVIVSLIATAVIGFLVYTNSGRLDQIIEVIGRIGSIKEVV